jgi:hypothetical protein
VSRKGYPVTPDGRYFVARSRLWRCTDPGLDEGERRRAVKALMQARRAVRFAEDEAARAEARDGVEAAKRRLGERGPVWWDDGAPDETGRAPWTTGYAAWWRALPAEDRDRGTAPRD